MHRTVLTEQQQRLLPLVRKFSPQFGLVGGTAIALQLGHRRSVDYDLFTFEPFDVDRIKKAIRNDYTIKHTFISGKNELTVLVNQVKMTFYYYPYKIEFREKLEGVISLPNLMTLAAMKALALGKRAKWKDYVDLYFIFKDHTLGKVVSRAEKLFGGEFNEKLFRVQLTYFEDIDYSEEIEFMPGFEVSSEVVKKALAEISLH